MKYELLGFCLALTALLTINVFASFLVAWFWRLLQHSALKWPANACVKLLFAFRILPATAAIICVFTLLLPAYLRHEPRQVAEPVSLKLGVLAAVSAAGLMLAIYRGFAAWYMTHRLVSNWLQNANPIKVAQVTIPAYRLKHPFPLIVVVGGLRPRLFIAGHLFDSLSRNELAAAITHECGHLLARDNIKRAMLHACRDLLTVLSCGRSLDRAWAEASEAAADEHAARAGGEVALDLASALVKIARLMPAGVNPITPALASFICQGTNSVDRRVRRLTQLATIDIVESKRWIYAINALLWGGLTVFMISSILIATNPQSLIMVHEFIEFVVSSLK